MTAPTARSPSSARRTSTALVVQRGPEQLARQAGLHPDLVRRFVRLGFVDVTADGAASRLVRAARLRRDLGVGYAGAILAVELLDRIDELEWRLSRYERVRR
jgi:chaperone modulatory protein CbpM